MKKLVVLFSLILVGAGIALAETDYTVARDVKLLKDDVADLQADAVMRADGVTTSFDAVLSGITNLVTVEDGQWISISPY